ncbi:uncharacterized protein hhla2b.2, partial [Nematolebias whitei]|uniref:uncharacterized protein hhla2b.2 n=1 Tax=Nematolebias whitei TaxID=451745 RepID=UPI0018994782
YFKDCILPCSFQGGDEVVVQYIYSENVHVHSFYQNQDDLDRQEPRFRNRTSLFKNELSKGNASLLLREVTVQDQGRYKCSVSTITGTEASIINLRVDAPVTGVRITAAGDRITCSSEGIYPEPNLTWSVISPLNTTLQSRYITQQPEHPLYSISSFLMVSDRVSDLVYNCTVRTRSNQRTAVVRQQSTNGHFKTIPCAESNSSLTNLVWRFNHSQIILTRPEGDASDEVSEEWRKHVKEVSESGGLTLQDLSPQQEGVYTCEVGGGDEEHTINHFILRVTPEQPSRTGSIIVGVIVVFLIAAAVLLLVFYCKSKTR